MAYRNRPVLDRKHRPRWQDELRSQQLVVAGFALTIAVALGLFGAWAWNGFYDGHLRQVVYAAGQEYTVDDVTRRQAVLEVELFARLQDVQSQMGTPQDQLVQQQLARLQQEANRVSYAAAESLVTAAFQRDQADGLGISVDEARVDELVAERTTLPLRIRLSAIYVNAEADADEEPTPAQMELARVRADGLMAQLRAGRDFAALAGENSDHSSAASGGDLGWSTDELPRDADLHEAARDAAVGELIGPIEIGGGYAIVTVTARRDSGPDQILLDGLDGVGVGLDGYRDYVRDLALEEAFRQHFETEVAGAVQPQRKIAQIFLAAEQGLPGPSKRARHILVAPDPSLDDQGQATEEQWDEALERATQIRERLLAGESFEELAAESDDPGSASRGGDLGWWKPNPDDPAFVPEFEAALGSLSVGEISEPVRTDFGYHVIEVTEQRISVADQAERLVADLREDPDSFASVAESVSEDPGTAADGGEVGWIARYETDPELEAAAFAMTEPGAISDPVEVPGRGTYILKLLDTAEARVVEADRRERILGSGYGRWLEERRQMANVWLAADYDEGAGGATTPGLPPGIPVP